MRAAGGGLIRSALTTSYQRSNQATATSAGKVSGAGAVEISPAPKQETNPTSMMAHPSGHALRFIENPFDMPHDVPVMRQPSRHRMRSSDELLPWHTPPRVVPEDGAPDRARGSQPGRAQARPRILPWRRCLRAWTSTRFSDQRMATQQPQALSRARPTPHPARSHTGEGASCSFDYQ
jgi:hypothetical protein